VGRGFCVASRASARLLRAEARNGRGRDLRVSILSRVAAFTRSRMTLICLSCWIALRSNAITTRWWSV